MKMKITCIELDDYNSNADFVYNEDYLYTFILDWNESIIIKDKKDLTIKHTPVKELSIYEHLLIIDDICFIPLNFLSKAEFNDEPYLYKSRIRIEKKYNPNYGDDRICKCGHPYYRHFDPYEDNNPVGCKYCQCGTFREKEN